MHWNYALIIGSRIDFAIIKKWCQTSSLPLILTLRKISQGGVYPHDEVTRLQTIRDLCAFKPDYVDLEFDIPQDFLCDLQITYPRIKFICSYHDFKSTPDDLGALLAHMQHPAFYAYKIATMAQCTLDALRLLLFVKYQQHATRLTCIGMGEAGTSTRILGPILGNTFTYASVSNEDKTAAGQLTLEELIHTYHVRDLNHASQIYALLGDPVDQSVGHILHNQVIRMLNKNAVYVKLKVSAADLQQVIALCRQLPFAGFSITMPLKENIIHAIDAYDHPLFTDAINSIHVCENKWLGFNTDGAGAMKALTEMMPLSDAVIVILGAGGAAIAIAKAALLQKARVMILNRTVSKAQQLAAQLGCEGGGLDQLSQLKALHYDAIINTLPVDLPLDNAVLREGIVAMDIVYQPINTSFLQKAKQSGCICIPGYQMYVQQALLQVKHWFQPNEQQLSCIKVSMTNYFHADHQTI